ncbi:MAG: ribose 5-phosphate isomerase A, partial [Planctomycetota bacterium]
MAALKREAARQALGEVKSGQIVGLGSGSTAAHFIDLLGEALASGKLSDIRGVPTSRESEQLARDAGIALTTLDEVTCCNVVVDGADEVDPELRLVKGLGGALLREKIVAQNSDRRVIIADASKQVDRLGTKGPLPVEVLPFAHERLPAFFESLGGRPVLRMASGEP